MDVKATHTSNTAKRWRLEAGQILLLVALIFAGRSSLADHYVVPTGSMEYTLMPGDRVFVDKRAFGLRVPFSKLDIIDGGPVIRGDVVIVDSPRDGKRLIKRIVAIGGDEVSIRNGRIAINGRPVAGSDGSDRFGSRRATLNLNAGGGPDLHIDRVPDGMLLAVGDHRGNSLDGRVFGLIQEDDVYGRAIAVYYRRGEYFVWKSL